MPPGEHFLKAGDIDVTGVQRRRRSPSNAWPGACPTTGTPRVLRDTTVTWSPNTLQTLDDDGRAGSTKIVATNGWKDASPFKSSCLLLASQDVINEPLRCTDALAAGPNVTVASLNIRGTPLTGSRLAARCQAIGAFFEASDVDVACFQEVHTDAHLVLLARQMRSFRHVSYRPSPLGPAGAVVTFSRVPVVSISFCRFGPVAAPIPRLARSGTDERRPDDDPDGSAGVRRQHSSGCQHRRGLVGR